MRTSSYALLPFAVFSILAAQPQREQSRWAEVNQAGSEALESGDRATAERNFRKAVALAEREPRSEENLAVSLTNLGQVLVERRKFAEAGTVFDRACGLWKKLEGERQNFALALSGKAGVLEAMGRKREAAGQYRRALELTEHALGSSHPAVASMLNPLATLYIGEHRYAEAKAMLDRAVVIARSHRDALVEASALNNLGGVLFLEKNYPEAQHAFEEALRLREAELGAEHPDVAVVLKNLADLLATRGQPREAASIYRRALAIDEKIYGPASPQAAADRQSLKTVHPGH